MPGLEPLDADEEAGNDSDAMFECQEDDPAYELAFRVVTLVGLLSLRREQLAYGQCADAITQALREGIKQYHMERHLFFEPQRHPL